MAAIAIQRTGLIDGSDGNLGNEGSDNRRGAARCATTEPDALASIRSSIAFRILPAVWNRSPGAFSSALANTRSTDAGIAGRDRRMDGAGVDACCANTRC